MTRAILLVTLGLLAPFDGLSGSSASAQGIEPLTRPQSVVDGGLFPGTSELWQEYGVRGSVVSQFGNGVGFDDGFASLDLFAPILGSVDQHLAFLDTRVVLDEFSRTSLNLGVGHRSYHAGLDRTFGLTLYYDRRELGPHSFDAQQPRFKFEQFSLIADSFGRTCDLRAGVYLPGAFEDHVLLPDRFVGNLLNIGRSATALTAGELEAGVRLPCLPSLQPKLWAGVYSFGGPGVSTTTGWRTRLETCSSGVVSGNMSLQHDDFFGTTFSVGLAVRLSSGRRSRPASFRGLCDYLCNPRDGVRERLDDPVYRLQQIVATQDPGQVAVDPTSGDPLMFLHVAKDGSGNGLFESPFGNITDAVNDPRYQAGDIDTIYVRRTGNPFTTFVAHLGDITLRPDTSLLSNGPVQFAATQLGLRQLPFSGASPDTANASVLGTSALLPDSTENPLIQGFVTVADNTAVSGFTFVTPSPSASQPGVAIAAGINGSSVDGVTLDSNLFHRGSISLQDATNTSITDNAFFRGDTAANVTLGGATFTGDVTGNTFNAPTPNIKTAILVQSSNVMADIKSNTFQMVAENSILLDGVTNFSGDIADNTLESSGGITGTGINAFSGNVTGNSFIRACDGIELAATTFAGNVSDNTFDGGEAGIELNVTSFSGDIADNVGINEGGGLAVVVDTFTGDIARNLFDIDRFGPFPTGINVSVGSMFSGDITANTVTGATDGGILVAGTGGFMGDISNNQTTGNSDFGIRVAVPTFTGGILNNGSGTTADDALGDRIEISDVTTFTGNVSGNRVGAAAGSIAGSGIRLSNVTTFQGNLSNNIVDDTNSNGLEVINTNLFMGNIAGNISRGNTGSGLRLAGVGMFAGDVSNNTTNGNASGISLAVTTITGSILDNTANNNTGGTGLYIEGTTLMGDVARNTANNNERGIRFFGLDSYVGNLTDNVTDGNTATGILLFTRTFNGNAAGTLAANVVGNQAKSNGGVGIELGVFPLSPSLSSKVSVRNNSFELNNSGGTEFLTRIGDGTLDLELTGNSSLNTVPGGQFNFDLIRSSGTFNVSPAGVDAANVGSVGSSNGSVTIP